MFLPRIFEGQARIHLSTPVLYKLRKKKRQGENTVFSQLTLEVAQKLEIWGIK